MANIRGAGMGPIITQRYLNTSTYAGDPTPGAVVSTSQVSGSIIQTYGGQLGGILTIDQAAANYYSDKVNGQQLYAGDYQYVQIDPNATASAAVQGQVVYWKSSTTNLLSSNYIVSIDETSAQLGFIAGIALCNTTKGNYWFIQTSGIANVKYAASNGVSGGSPQTGDLVTGDYATPSNLAYDPSQTGTPGVLQIKSTLGTAWQNTTPGTIGLVLLSGTKYVPGGGGGEG